MRNVYIYGDSLLKATVPDEELKYHFHLPEIMARYPSDRVQVTNRAKMGATVSKGLSLVEHDAARGLDADYALSGLVGSEMCIRDSTSPIRSGRPSARRWRAC